MMLIAGIEVEDGKSSLAEPGAAGVGGADGAGVRSPAPVVACGAPDGVAAEADAVVLPLAGQASA